MEDDWKVSQKLSINYGLRWDFRLRPMKSEPFLLARTTNPQGGLRYADQAVKLVRSGAWRWHQWRPNSPLLRQFAPRRPEIPLCPPFRFNYRVDDKTVVRGGYGVFFDSFEGREIDDSADIYPYSIRNNLTPTTVAGTPKLTDQMFPSYSTLGPFPETSPSFIAVIESENPLDPTSSPDTLSAERELANNTTLEVFYVGTKGKSIRPIDTIFRSRIKSLRPARRSARNGLSYRQLHQPQPGSRSGLAACPTQTSTGLISTATSTAISTTTR